MPVKTILVPLESKSEAEKVLGPATRLAAKHQAHLIGLRVSPNITAVPGYGFDLPAELITSYESSNRAQAEAIRTVFDRFADNEVDVQVEWRAEQAISADTSNAIVEHARRADLVMMMQPSEDDSTMRWELSGKMILDSGRPVLLVPYAGTYETVGERVMIAWNGSRECARAVFDALPLMREAKEVRLFAVGGKAHSDTSDLPGAEIAAVLSRHGLDVIAEPGRDTPLSVADELLNHAADCNTDLIVMGGYGHSRAREFLFGGVTRSILKTMTAPVLFSH